MDIQKELKEIEITGNVSHQFDNRNIYIHLNIYPKKIEITGIATPLVNQWGKQGRHTYFAGCNPRIPCAGDFFEQEFPDDTILEMISSKRMREVLEIMDLVERFVYLSPNWESIIGETFHQSSTVATV